MLLLILACLSLESSSAPASHQVLSLPGFGTFPFLMYSGYIPIPNSLGIELHYVFYTSQNVPSTDPVMLWLNGGPGCSSMEGAFVENGPIVFSDTNSSLVLNPYSWNRLANMLYLETPAGVGYSMLGDVSNNSTDDNQTALHNLQALIGWYSLFPEYLSNSFYISGESYAGVYVPTLSYAILMNNQNSSSPIKINLKGFMVGNPVTDWHVDTDSVWPSFLYWHQLIDDTIYFPWVNMNCSLLWPSNPACDPLADKMYDLFTRVNYYDIYRECTPDGLSGPHKARWLSAERLGGISSCLPDGDLVDYLNTPKVRNALHINTTLGAWEECANIDYYQDMNLGSIYLYPSLIQSGIRIHVYSGDTDSCVPTQGTRAWIDNLNMQVTVPWKEWMLNGQVAGFATRYGLNFSFSTIRGSGHMCIQWKRPEGFATFQAFLNGQDLS